MLAREAGGRRRAEGAGGGGATHEVERHDSTVEHEGEGWVLGWGPRGCG
jgi:hypothetical protein